jgi:hypothetical protein
MDDVKNVKDVKDVKDVPKEKVKAVSGLEAFILARAKYGEVEFNVKVENVDKKFIASIIDSSQILHKFELK